jgi:response regulator RpfG family c-di-GMP phosphodiesterase
MERPDIHVLYTSGYADKVTAHAGVERAVQVLGKPFLPLDLLRRVRGILDTPTPANRPSSHLSNVRSLA